MDKASAGTPSANTFTDVEQKTQRQYLSANSTAQIGNSLRTRIAYNSAWFKQEGRLPNQTGSNSTTTLFDINDITPSWSLSGQADWVVTPTFFVGARLGYYYSDSFNEGVPAEPLYQFTNSNNIGLVGTNGVAVRAAVPAPTN